MVAKLLSSSPLAKGSEQTLRTLAPESVREVRAMQPTLGSQQVFRGQTPQYSAIPPQTPAQPERVAVIVTHGMGQQVPYETIEAVALAVARGAEQAKQAGAVASQPVIRNVRLGTAAAPTEPELIRAEFAITDERSKKWDVHIYEAYWAPLTEGKVTAQEVIGFLFDAGRNGICNTEAGTFKRWMFGEEREFKLNKFVLTLAFLSVMALLAALLLINAVVVAAAASHAIGAAKSFPTGDLLVGLTWDLLVVDLAAILIAFGIWIGRSKAAAVRTAGWLLIGIGAGAILYAATLMGFRLAGWIQPTSFTPGDGWNKFVASFSIVVLLLWVLEVLAAREVRILLIEYVGDITAYIAAHTVSKFWDLRQQIWQTAVKVALAVYRARTADDSAYLYEKIIVVGHSLGSVISYDVLNGLLLEKAFSSPGLRVAKRTRMFLTFGSPLDKTAFLFRTQKDMDSPIREVAAAAVQPMIVDYSNRPQEWVNLWSRADIISGNLDYYDPPNVENARHPVAALAAATVAAPRENPLGRAVQNIIDPDAHTPLAAHVQYWTGSLFAQHLYRGITT
jgi:hypothetical protein